MTESVKQIVDEVVAKYQERSDFTADFSSNLTVFEGDEFCSTTLFEKNHILVVPRGITADNENYTFPVNYGVISWKQTISKEMFKGIVAHEIAHMIHGDTVNETPQALIEASKFPVKASFTVGCYDLISRYLKFSRRLSPAQSRVNLGVFASAVVVGRIGNYLSQRQEYRADSTAATLGEDYRKGLTAFFTDVKITDIKIKVSGFQVVWTLKEMFSELLTYTLINCTHPSDKKRIRNVEGSQPKE